VKSEQIQSNSTQIAAAIYRAINSSSSNEKTAVCHAKLMQVTTPSWFNVSQHVMAIYTGKY